MYHEILPEYYLNFSCNITKAFHEILPEYYLNFSCNITEAFHEIFPEIFYVIFLWNISCCVGCMNL